MKAWVHYTENPNDEVSRVEEINTLAELLELLDKEGSELIISRNILARPMLPGDRKRLIELAEEGELDCELDLEVYNDYRE